MSKTRLPSRALLAAIAALGGLATLSNAQSVATAPVGAISTSVTANSDQRLGITLQRPSLFTAAASVVSASTITASSTVPGLGSAQKYVKFTSGTLVGQWFTLISSTGSTLTVAENLQTLGALAGDKFEIRPFWTLATLFPNGAGLPVSSDPFSPIAFIFLNDPAAVGVNLAASSVYFYHDGSVFDAGWYNNDGSFVIADTTVVSPETSIVIRNTTASAAKVLNIGDVPASKVANTIVSRVAGPQDNLVYNPYPSSISLGASGLAGGAVKASSDPFDPTDLLLVYTSSASGLNGAASDVYFYHDGSVFDAGWYKNDGSFVVVNSTLLPAGAAITIRKAAGTSTEVTWTPALPYTL